MRKRGQVKFYPYKKRGEVMFSHAHGVGGKKVVLTWELEVLATHKERTLDFPFFEAHPPLPVIND